MSEEERTALAHALASVGIGACISGGSLAMIWVFFELILPPF